MRKSHRVDYLGIPKQISSSVEVKVRAALNDVNERGQAATCTPRKVF